ncbi:hypothetical protein [Paraburkholderia elongata]|uniref:Uncharacterized protein n=1 Tax=Paraburkholderia elongata TaxID=2675747 RepID=A0A972NS23_9BURK|nr:hypothetical protein [Paraburkholderia elongata]NPT57383.1 hypothetical protein [Paraburkholderia elongata]
MHNDAKGFAAQMTERESGERPSYSSDTAGLLRYLLERVDSEVNSIPDAELEWLANASSQTKMMAGNLGEMLGQVAALVGYEINAGGQRSGGLQPYGLEQLLLHASDTLMTIERMTEISELTEWALRERWKQRVMAARSTSNQKQGGRDNG